MTQDVTPHQRWVEWEQRRGKGSSLGARSGDGPTHKVKRPFFRGYVSFRECSSKGRDRLSSISFVPGRTVGFSGE